jgi:hypothetical protein
MARLEFTEIDMERVFPVPWGRDIQGLKSVNEDTFSQFEAGERSVPGPIVETPGTVFPNSKKQSVRKETQYL